MSQPIPVEILSDSDSDPGDNRRYHAFDNSIDLTTPSPLLQSKKKQRIEGFSNPRYSPVFIIDDDLTPCKDKASSLGRISSPTPLFVAETPFSGCSRGHRSYSGRVALSYELNSVIRILIEHILNAIFFLYLELYIPCSHPCKKLLIRTC